MGSSVFPAPSTSSVTTGLPLTSIPAGVTLQATYTSTQSITVPKSPVFVVVVGGGGGGGTQLGGNATGGGAGGVAMGWCNNPTSVTIGAGGTSGSQGGSTYVDTFPIPAAGGKAGSDRGAFAAGQVLSTGATIGYDLIPAFRNGQPGYATGQGEDVGLCSGGGGGTGSGTAGRGGNSSIYSKTGGAANTKVGGGGAGVAGNGAQGTAPTGGAGGLGGGGGGGSGDGGTTPVGGTGGAGAVLIYY